MIKNAEKDETLQENSFTVSLENNHLIITIKSVNLLGKKKLNLKILLINYGKLLRKNVVLQLNPYVSQSDPICSCFLALSLKSLNLKYSVRINRPLCLWSIWA